MFNKIYEKIKDFIVNNYKFLITLIAIVLLFTIELPYVVYIPGGIVELGERVEVSDAYESDGSLNMSYVTLLKGKIPLLAMSFIMKDWDIKKSDEITRDDQSVNELLELEKLYMESSIDNATIVAYKAANKEINIKSNINNVVYITKEADTNLEVYDKVLSIEGIEIDNVSELKNIVNSKKEGDKVSIVVERNGKEVVTTSTIYNTSDGLKVGVVFLTTYEYDTNPSVEVKMKSKESGSSGGLMLSLEIYNDLTEEDITHGKKIVGTGTIEVDGTVGAIDGVKYKLLGAVKNKADIFICPEKNYEEAKKVKDEKDLDIEVISVKTFAEAIKYLETI